MLLWLSVDEVLEKRVSWVYVGFFYEFFYCGEYLKDFVKSIFELEC